ncbi:uncharacterized protein tbc1d10c [Salminus brasiliensis]|uniref:uncharacterized protein tbc1d10c n=1 Tax=Salminus brasiliensis TaxID=930266 RepID=UPI003B82D06A
MSDHSEQKADDQGTSGFSGLSGAETDRYGFLLGNGDTHSNSDEPCPQLVRHREMKWLSLMNHWDQVLEKKTSKIKGQCQKGIPASVRAKCWPLLCGATHRKKKNETLYTTLEKAPGQQSWIDVIKRDTDRQFPFHEMFLNKDSHGQQGLLQVLKAYTQFRPEEGYCQAQGPVAAVLLMNMPMEEAFWCLVQISELYLPGYYSPLLEGVLFDASLLSGVLKRTCPAAYKHLQSQGVEPLMFATDWLMCLYSRHLPFNTLLRVWDLFFCYGVRVLFQVAVVLVRRCLGEARQRKECEGQMETLEQLRAVRGRVQHEPADAFIQEVCSVPLSSSDLQRQTEKELKKWKKERPGSTFDPRHRCHGYHMVWEKGRENEKESEKKEKQSGNLTVPLTRSHSSLTPTLLRKKWRKRGNKAETEEWEGGGRRFSQDVKAESADREQRTRSMCSMAEEFRTNTDSVSYETDMHFRKDYNTLADTHLTQCGQLDTWSSSELSVHSVPVFEEEDENDIGTTPDPPQSETHTASGGQEEDAMAGKGERGTETQMDSIPAQQDQEKIQTDRGGQDEETSSHQEGKDDRGQQVEGSLQEEETQVTSYQCKEDTQGNSNEQLEETELTERGEQQQEEEEVQMDNRRQLNETEETHSKQPEEEIHPGSGDQVEEVEVQEEKEEEIHETHEEDTETEECTILDNCGDELLNSTTQETEVNSSEQEVDLQICSKQDEGKQASSNDGDDDQDTPDGKQQQEEKAGELEPQTSEDQEHLPLPSQVEEEVQKEEVEVDTGHLEGELNICESKRVQQDQAVERDRQITDNPEGPKTMSKEAVKGKDVEVEDRKDEEGNRNLTVDEEKLHKTELEHLETSDVSQVVESSPQREEISNLEGDHTEDQSELTLHTVTASSSVFTHIQQETEQEPSETSQESSQMVECSPQTEEIPNLEADHIEDQSELTLHTVTASSSVFTHIQQETEQEPSGTSPESSQVVERSPQTEDISNLEADPKVDEETSNTVVGSSSTLIHVEQKTQAEHSGTSESSPVVESPPPVEKTDLEVTTIPEIQPGFPKHDGLSSNPEPETVVMRNTAVQNEPVLVQSQSTTPANPPKPASTASSSNPHLRLRRSSSSQSSYPTILSEDTFKDPHDNNKQEHKAGTAPSTANLVQQTQTSEPDADVAKNTNSKTLTLPLADKPKRRGLFHRFRGETAPKSPKSPVPKILIQDFSEGEEKLSSKERRRRRREQERKEKEEEKERKRREKELEKEKEKERKKPQTRGKSFQVLSRKDEDNDSSPCESGSQTSRSKRNSASHSESYF